VDAIPSGESQRPRLALADSAALLGGLQVEPLSVALVAEGSVRARIPGESATTIHCGGVLIARGSQLVVVDARAKGSPALLTLFIPSTWLSTALFALGPERRSPLPAETIVLDPHTSSAQAFARALRRAWLQAETSLAERHPFEWSARALDLAGRALVERGRALSRDPDVQAARPSREFLPALVDLVASADGVPPTLTSLADNIGLSERQTSRLFRAQTGQSFRHYSASLRVERAMKLLATSNRPVTEIALSSGWNSLSQFNAAFRKYAGTTPGAYRRAHRAGVSQGQSDRDQKEMGIV